jgi:hypothetical protein
VRLYPQHTRRPELVALLHARATSVRPALGAPEGGRSARAFAQEDQDEPGRRGTTGLRSPRARAGGQGGEGDHPGPARAGPAPARPRPEEVTGPRQRSAGPTAERKAAGSPPLGRRPSPAKRPLRVGGMCSPRGVSPQCCAPAGRTPLECPRHRYPDPEKRCQEERPSPWPWKLFPLDSEILRRVRPG